MTTLIFTLLAARRAGLDLERDGDRLTVRGPKTAAGIVAAIQKRKPEVLSIADFYAGKVAGLDWHSAKVAKTSGRCVLCQQKAILLDPYDQQPAHKTCVERALAPTDPQGVTP